MHTYEQLQQTFSQLRFRHRFIIGQSQSGKSNALNQFALDDIESDLGMLYIDTEGEDIDTILLHFPKRRKADIILVDFSDTAFPVAWNPLEGHTGDYRSTVAELFVDAFKSIWGYANVSTPDMDRTIYNTAIALMDYPQGTILGMYYFLVHQDFRERVVKTIKDPIVKNYWERQFPKIKDKNAILKSTVNKIERFVSDPRIKHSLGQYTSAFNLKDAIEQRKVILVKIPQSELGLSKARTTAGLLFAQFYSIAQRRKGYLPFHVYLPTAQDVGGATLEQMLSTIGKKSVSLTMCAQYLDQFDDETRAALFGNVGNWTIFRVGLQDAEQLEELFKWDNTTPPLFDLPMYAARTLYAVGLAEICAFDLLDGTPNRKRAKSIVTHGRFCYAQKRGDVAKKLNKFERGIHES